MLEGEPDDHDPPTFRHLPSPLHRTHHAFAAPAARAAAQFINILTGGTSGVYYPMGVALSKIYAEKIPGVRTQVQSTKASVENLNLLQTGRGELALALGRFGQVGVGWR